MPWIVGNDHEVEFLKELSGYPDRIVGLIAPELLNQAVVTAIKSHWQDDDGELFADLFRDGGPLGSFATRIKIGFAIRLYGKETYSDLKLINKIRNDFAHNVRAKDFNWDPVKSRANSLKTPDKYRALSEHELNNPPPFEEMRAKVGQNHWMTHIAWA
jgi:DNA-binding MltR family transcriptional regulator